MHIAFGPDSGLPSWEWVGRATGQAMSAVHEVSYFDSFHDVPQADIVVVIKYPAPPSFVEVVHARGARLVFVPLDHYESAEAVNNSRHFLQHCDLVLAHSPALVPFLESHCRLLRTVEHHARYALPELAAYRSTGFLLWIGAAQHLPHVVAWLAHRPPAPLEIRLLSNLNDRHAHASAQIKAHALGISLRVRNGTVNGLPVLNWSEAVQRDVMSQCRAAFDIKGSDFNQSTKPATKAQQFIASGISFGCNPGSSIATWLQAHGFDVAMADDYGRLLSRDYWMQIQDFGRNLRQSLSLEVIMQTWQQAFEAMLAKSDGGEPR